MPDPVLGLSVADFRSFGSSPLGDEALQKLLDEAQQAIIGRVGLLGAVSIRVRGGGPYIVLPSRADRTAPLTVTEWYESDNPVLLDDDDWELGHDNVSLRRLGNGTNPAAAWANGFNQITYFKSDDLASRLIVQRDLVKLALEYDPLLTQESIDGYAYQKSNNANWSYPQERESILARLDPPDVGFR